MPPRPWLLRLTVTTALCSQALLGGSADATNVTLNQDGVLLIDGRETFSIGFSNGPPPGSVTPWGTGGLAELAAAGGTLIRTGTNGTMGWDEECIARERVWQAAAAEAGVCACTCRVSCPLAPLVCSDKTDPVGAQACFAGRFFASLRRRRRQRKPRC